MRYRLAISILLGGCGAAPAATTTTTTERAPRAETVEIVASEGAQNAPPVITPAPEAAAPEAAATEDMITVAPGFQPDPIVRSGMAGGPRSADALDEHCRGFVAVAPSHLLKVDALVPQLRVLVAMEGDATLVIQLADGSYLCDDDSEGLNPILDGPFPPGRHRVWVGTYSPTPPGGTRYTLAVTTQPISTSQIQGAPPTP